MWQALEFPEDVVLRTGTPKHMRTKLGDAHGTLRVDIYVSGEYEAEVWEIIEKKFIVIWAGAACFGADSLMLLIRGRAAPGGVG